jgi:hypothetical protein
MRSAPSPTGERVPGRVELSTRAIGSFTRSSGTPQHEGLDELQRVARPQNPRKHLPHTGITDGRGRIDNRAA